MALNDTMLCKVNGDNRRVIQNINTVENYGIIKNIGDNPYER